MQVIGVRSVPVSKLCLDGSFGTRMKAPRIADRAKSIEDFELLYEPLVRESDYRVIDGRDRIAACMQLDRSHVAVKLLECTDEECEVLERITTIERRHDPAEQATALKELIDRYQDRLDSATPEPPKAGRPKSSRAKAREKVAAEVGIKPDTLRKREERRKKAAIAAAPDLLAPEPPIRVLGMDLEEGWLKQVGEVQDRIDDAASLLSRAQAVLTALMGTALPVPSSLQRIKEELHSCAAALRGARPESLCPHCKGLAGVQEICLCCGAIGYVTSSQTGQIPKELWDEDDPVVTIGGRLTKVSQVRQSRLP